MFSLCIVLAGPWGFDPEPKLGARPLHDGSRRLNLPRIEQTPPVLVDLLKRQVRHY
jgi:hypothetical protein